MVVLFLPFAAAGAVMSGQMRSEGATQKAMTLQLIGIVTNNLDPIFILGPAWDCRSSLGNHNRPVASFGYGIFYFFKENCIVDQTKGLCAKQNDAVSGVVDRHPRGLSGIIMSVSNILNNRILGQLWRLRGCRQWCSYAGSRTILYAYTCSVMGYQPFAGYNYGAKLFDRVRKGFKLTLIFATGLCIAGKPHTEPVREYVIKFWLMIREQLRRVQNIA